MRHCALAPTDNVTIHPRPKIIRLAGPGTPTMLPITLYLLLLLPVFLAAGVSLHDSFARACLRARLPGEAPLPPLAMDEALVLGIVGITMLTSLVSLFHGIHLHSYLIICVAVLLLGRKRLGRFFTKESLGKYGLVSAPLLLIGALISTGSLVLLATSETVHYDTGLYHAQMVQWTKFFGAVPGLANLHDRLGFNSAWDVFASFLDQSYFTGRTTHIVGLIIGLILLQVALRGLRDWTQGNRSLTNLMRMGALVVIMVNFHGAIMVSYSSDWPIYALIYYAVLLGVEQIEMNDPADPDASVLRFFKCAIICLFAVTVKLSSLPVLALLLLWLRPGDSLRRILPAASVAAGVVLIPHLIRNVILTGYLLFPFPKLDLFSFDWKVPVQEAEATSELIRNWAISPSANWPQVSAMGLHERFDTWLKWRGAESLTIVLWFGLGLLLWAGISSLKRARRQPDFIPLCTVCLVLIGGVMFGVVTAPDARFFAGWVWTFTLLLAAWLGTVMLHSKYASRRLLNATAFVFLGVCTLWLVRHAGIRRLVHEEGTSLWVVDQLPASPTRLVTSNHGVTVALPVTGDQCWDAVIPTTTRGEFNPWLQARGSGLDDGFRATKAGTPTVQILERAHENQL